MARKPPAEWTPAYAKRIKNYVERNPFTATLDAARGHKKPEPVFLPHQQHERTLHALAKLEDNLKLRGKVGNITQKDMTLGLKDVAQMKRGVEEIRKKKPGTKAYEAQRKKNSNAYQRLIKRGLLEEDRDNEITGEIYYH